MPASDRSSIDPCCPHARNGFIVSAGAGPSLIAFGIGAVVASAFLVGTWAFEPAYDGPALVPALVGGLVFGVTVELVTR
jgi:hypothetical protein